MAVQIYCKPVRCREKCTLKMLSSLTGQITRIIELLAANKQRFTKRQVLLTFGFINVLRLTISKLFYYIKNNSFKQIMYICHSLTH